MSKLLNFLYGTEVFKFVFDIPVDIALERLSSEVGNTSFSNFTKEGMVGSVTKEKVKIQRILPMVQNSFKPFLVGSFYKEGNKTILHGVFRFHRFVQVFMTFWFGFIVFWFFLASAAVFLNQTDQWYFPLFGVFMFGAGIGMVNLGKWFARNDKAWLELNITNAINKNL